MKTFEVTNLEKQVLEALASMMDAEPGYSNAGLPEVVGVTRLDSKVVRGVAGSLVKKGLVEIDDRRNEWGINPNDPDEHIWYLMGVAAGLVEEWVNEPGSQIEAAQLIVK